MYPKVELSWTVRYSNMDGSKILRICAIIFFVLTPESVTDAPAEGGKAAAWWSAICLSTAINSTCQGNLANRAGLNINVEMKLFS